MKLPERFQFYSDSIASSYSQILFSNELNFGWLLLVVSFINPFAGVSSLSAVIFTNLLAKWLGLDSGVIRSGGYGFNAVLIGLVMGIYYDFGFTFFLVLMLGCFITLLLTVWMSVKSAAFKIQFLSLPFVLGVWIILLSSRSIGAIHLTERGVYELNELWALGGSNLVTVYEQVNAWDFPFAIDIYLKSLGSIFFEYNLIAGTLIALGMLFYSRISFTLSLVAFYSGYMFCLLTQGNIDELNNTYLGFNFILTGLAIGIYVVPSLKSYLLTIVAMPVVSVVMGAMDVFLATYQLPIFSLPFSLVVIGLVFLLMNRGEAAGMPIVVDQRYNPEKNLYSFWINGERFKNATYYHIQLPFFGEWRISQGHAGGITHKGDWSDAWDFDIADETGKTYRFPGKEPSDFYCYGLPVLAPAAGYIMSVINEVEENSIGNVNTVQNWGNTIVIKHAEYLYSKISHLKKDSFKVKVGDYVYQGDIIAACGNSGRSPEPHVHFQLQAASHVGSKTLSYPISYYLSKGAEGRNQFHAFEIPAEGAKLFNPEPNDILQRAFCFIPGQKLKFETTANDIHRSAEWEVLVDAYNQSYLYCHYTKSAAYFSNNGVTFYFTRFYGDRKSLLYSFYLGAYKILLSGYPNLTVHDALSIDGFYNGALKAAHDFIAPFYQPLKATYTSGCREVDDESVVLVSNAVVLVGAAKKKEINFEFKLNLDGIERFSINEMDTCIEARRLL